MSIEEAAVSSFSHTFALLKPSLHRRASHFACHLQKWRELRTLPIRTTDERALERYLWLERWYLPASFLNDATVPKARSHIMLEACVSVFVAVSVCLSFCASLCVCWCVCVCVCLVCAVYVGNISCEMRLDISLLL